MATCFPASPSGENKTVRFDLGVREEKSPLASIINIYVCKPAAVDSLLAHIGPQNVQLYQLHQVRAIFRVMGCKSVHTQEIVAIMWANMQRMRAAAADALREAAAGLSWQERPACKGLRNVNAEMSVVMRENDFEQLVYDSMSSHYPKPVHRKVFNLSRAIYEERTPLVLMLSGTSGTGKSTLASLLAHRFGFTTVVTTDSIRHLLRTVVDREKEPSLFVSTYEAHETLPPEQTAQRSHGKRVRQGYKSQCRLVTQKLGEFIGRMVRQKHSVIIEGVHCHIKFLVEQLKKFPCVVPFLIFISNEDKHRERFSVRTKYMTIDPRHNKYVKNFPHIRVIQKYLVKRANRFLIPKIDNTNVDRSMAAIHSVLLRCIRHIAAGRPLFHARANKAVLLHEEYTRTQEFAWSSKAMQKVIRMQVQKKELFRRLFDSGPNMFNHVPVVLEAGSGLLSLPLQHSSSVQTEERSLTETLSETPPKPPTEVSVSRSRVASLLDSAPSVQHLSQASMSYKGHAQKEPDENETRILSESEDSESEPSGEEKEEEGGEEKRVRGTSSVGAEVDEDEERGSVDSQESQEHDAIESSEAEEEESEEEEQGQEHGTPLRGRMPSQDRTPGYG